jgi:predicted nucleotidyltransferase component of viral defense system
MDGTGRDGLMREDYQKQVALLLDVLPIVNKQKVFALKGGTAINFFFRNCPRLSVDIDLHYLPDKNREDALADILNTLQVIKTDIEKAMPGANVVINSKKYHASVQYNHVLIKIEPNTVIRGTLSPVVEMPLCAFLVKDFDREMQITCVSKEEIFAGKLCAALQRQHPRDLFDVLLLLKNEEGLTRELMDVFIIYLISQGKPINEMLNPNIHDIESLFYNQFQGMTRLDAVSLESLIQVQNTLPQAILDLFTEADIKFITDFKRGEPDWSLLAFSNIKDLPAVRWKQKNLNKMDVEKRQQAIKKLEQVFE